MANVMQQQQNHHQQQLVVMQQPEYSNNSSASTTLAGAAMNSFTATAEAAAAVSYDVMAPANLEHSLQPVPRHQLGSGNQHEDEEESGTDFSVAVGSTALAAEVIFPAEGFHRI